MQLGGWSFELDQRHGLYGGALWAQAAASPALREL